MNIREYRYQFASFNFSFELARYRYHVGLQSELNSAEIYARHSDLFTPVALADLKSALDQTPSNFETERVGLQKLLDAAQLRYVEMQGGELTKELSQCESSIQIEWKGEKIPLEGFAVRFARELGNQRRELAVRRADSISICNELRINTLGLFREAARTLGFNSYSELEAGATNNMLDRTDHAAHSLLDQTESAYRSA